MAHQLATDYLARLPSRVVAGPATAVTIPDDLPEGPTPPRQVVDELGPASTRASSPTPAGGTSGSSSAALSMPPWRPTWSPSGGTSTPSTPPVAGGGGRRAARRALAAGPAPPPCRRDGRLRHRRAEANTVGLAAARHHVLAEAGWDVELDGLAGGPPCAWSPAGSATPPSTGRCGSSGSAPRGRTVAAAEGRARRRRPAGRVLASGVDGPTIVCAAGG